MSSKVDDERTVEVLRLRYVEGLGIRKIAARMKMARKTVRRLLGQARTPPPTARTPRTSILAPFEQVIRDEIARAPDLSVPGMLERLRPLGYTGGQTVLRERMRLMRPKPSIAVYSRFELRPAERLEVDWADMGFWLPGVARRVSAFVAVLAYSRMLYVEFVFSQQMGSFLRCMERSLGFFGGRTAVDVFDNMKTVVLGRTAAGPIYHPRFVEYARVRGFAISATAPRQPTGKPFVERGIGFVRTRFCPGRRFADLDHLRLEAGVWRDSFANGREHETTGKIPALVYEHEEKHVLAPLVERPFDTDDTLSTGVGRTHRVHFDRNDYTAPWRLAGQTVLVRANDSDVRVVLGPKEVARHPRSWQIRDDVRDPAHEHGMREASARRHAGVLPDALEPLAERGRRYFALLAATRRSIRHETVRLVWLVELFGERATADAMDEVMRTGHVGADYVEYVLRHKRRLMPGPPPLRLGDAALDALSAPEPDLGVYDAIAAHPTRDPGEPPATPEQSE